MDEPGNGSAWECYYSASSRTYELLKDGFSLLPPYPFKLSGNNPMAHLIFPKALVSPLEAFPCPRDLIPNLERLASLPTVL